MTLRELLAMAEARLRDEWSRTSCLMALMANCHRDPKRKRAFRPSDFDPFSKPTRVPKVGVEILRDVFVEGRLPRVQGGARCERG